jgi:preprotein translocase subunit Sss1
MKEFLDDAFLFSVGTLYLGVIGFAIAMIIGYFL